MKISRNKLRQIINETINESDLSDPLADAIAKIEKQFGKGSAVDSGSATNSGAGDRLSNNWMQFVIRNPRYQDILLHVWDHLIDGDDPLATKKIYLNDLDNNESIAGAITYYGRRILPGENYLTSAQLKEKIKIIKAEKEEARKNVPPKPWKRPKYGMGTRIDPKTGEEIQWTGTHERFS